MAKHGTAISWTHQPGTTGKTWNPLRARNWKTGEVGWFCVHVSPGCENCYAETWNGWRGNGVKYRAQDRELVEVYLDEKTLTQPLRWRKPCTIFVCSMTDLHGDFVEDEWLDRIYAVMALCPQHTFQVLTKRAERQRKYLMQVAERATKETISPEGFLIEESFGMERGISAPRIGWPLPNVWAGVSVEDQKTADARVPVLLETLAAIRIVSYEPALGAVDFDPWLYDLDQIIVGGESGKGARAFNLGWARKTIADCKAAGVACFVKQLGSNPGQRGALIGDTGFVAMPPVSLRDKKGADPAEWPLDLQIQEFPRWPLHGSRAPELTGDTGRNAGKGKPNTRRLDVDE